MIDSTRSPALGHQTVREIMESVIQYGDSQPCTGNQQRHVGRARSAPHGPERNRLLADRVRPSLRPLAAADPGKASGRTQREAGRVGLDAGRAG